MMRQDIEYPYVLPESPLYFCGNRTYIQGYLQVKYVYICFSNIYGDDVMKRLKLKRFNQKHQTSTEIALVPYDFKISEQNMRALIDIEVDGESSSYKVIAIEGTPPRRESLPCYYEEYAEKEKTCNAVVKKNVDFWTLLNESIQVLKKYHINYYIKPGEDMHFWIGGIDDLTFFVPDPKVKYSICCHIKPIYVRKEKVYNYCQVELKGGGHSIKYRVPFIGESVSR